MAHGIRCSHKIFNPFWQLSCLVILFFFFLYRSFVISFGFLLFSFFIILVFTYGFQRGNVNGLCMHIRMLLVHLFVLLFCFTVSYLFFIFLFSLLALWFYTWISIKVSLWVLGSVYLSSFIILRTLHFISSSEYILYRKVGVVPAL